MELQVDLDLLPMPSNLRTAAISGVSGIDTWHAMKCHLSWSKKANSAGAHCQAGHERVTWSLVLYNPTPCPGGFQLQQNAFLIDDSDTQLDPGNVAKTFLVRRGDQEGLSITSHTGTEVLWLRDQI